MGVIRQEEITTVDSTRIIQRRLDAHGGAP